MNIDFEKIKNVHFVGVGGIGVSAVARMFLLAGKKVSGSDTEESMVTDELKKFGVKIYIGHHASNLRRDVDLVVFSIAVSKDNPELSRAREIGIVVLSYPESLSIISKEKFTIAVSGTHGKTTTTAMIAKMMIDAELDPTVIVGSFMKVESKKDQKFIRTNFIGGRGEFFVVEACEYRRSFLNITPSIVIITNIDDDHLDYYKDIKDIESSFSELVAKLPKTGFVVCDLSSKFVRLAVKKAPCAVIDYSKIRTDNLKLKIPGRHNKENAKIVLALASILEIPEETALKSLANFSGTWRRFEYKGMTQKGALIFEDYGHHPTEIKATLQSARELFPKNKITVVFQPHLYSRTKILLSKFADAFGEANKVLLLPIYAARELFDPSISSEMLAKVIKAQKNNKGKIIQYVEQFKKAEKLLKSESEEGEVIIVMGAGDVYKLTEKVVRKDQSL
jgi:UDP-N-acetylmuramate--alanine ligase